MINVQNNSTAPTINAISHHFLFLIVNEHNLFDNHNTLFTSQNYGDSHFVGKPALPFWENSLLQRRVGGFSLCCFSMTCGNMIWKIDLIKYLPNHGFPLSREWQIGYSIIPAKAGIQFGLLPVYFMNLHSREWQIGCSVIPAKAGIQYGRQRLPDQSLGIHLFWSSTILKK